MKLRLCVCERERGGERAIENRGKKVERVNWCGRSKVMYTPRYIDEGGGESVEGRGAGEVMMSENHEGEI